jgi:hypothetical protein
MVVVSLLDMIDLESLIASENAFFAEIKPCFMKLARFLLLGGGGAKN